MARPGWIAVIVVLSLGLVLFLAGNAHLLVVSLTSQPACMEHVKVGQNAVDGFAAAQSAC
jgi:hypothetical protein